MRCQTLGASAEATSARGSVGSAWHQNYGLTVENSLTIHLAVARHDGAFLLRQELGDTRDGHNNVVDLDGRAKIQALGQVDCTRAGQLGPQNGGEEARRQDTMGDPFLENRAGGKFIVEMDWVTIAGHVRKRQNVIIRYALGVAGLHPDLEILEIVHRPRRFVGHDIIHSPGPVSLDFAMHNSEPGRMLQLRCINYALIPLAKVNTTK
jgi:hypothetical protein